MAIQQAGGNFTVSDNHAHMAMKSVDKNGDRKLSKDEVYVIYQGFIKNIDQFIGPKQNWDIMVQIQKKKKDIV